MPFYKPAKQENSSTQARFTVNMLFCKRAKQARLVCSSKHALESKLG